jgi:Tfp pilus assembly PilM family ATPase
VALAEGSGAQCRIRAIHSQPIGVIGETAEALRGLLRSTVKSAAAQVIGVVAREQVITRVVKFPTIERGELAQMAELYAKAQLPYPREQTVMDFHVLSQREGFTTLAIVACQRDLVGRQLALLREAGLSPALLTVSSWGVLGWYRQILHRSGAGQAVQANSIKEPSLVVNVDDTRTDLVLIADGRILSSRSVGQGAQDWEPLGETTDLLGLEVERSRAAIRKELPGTEVRSIILTGLGALGQWNEPLSQRLGLPVIVIDGKEPLQLGATPMSTPISPVVVGGLACSEVRELLNLSPPEMRVQVRHRQQVRELVRVALLLMGVLALGSSLLALQLFRQRNMTVQLDQALMDIEPTAKRIQVKSRSAQLVGSMLEGRRRLAMTLSGIFHITPTAVTLEGLTFERAKREVVLRGNAASTQAVLDYIKQLEHLEGVGGVDLKYSTRRSTPAGERTDFELALRPWTVNVLE